MKARTLVPALALAAALLAPPVTEAASRHRSYDGGRRPPAHGYYNHRPSYRSNHGYYGHGYRAPRSYYRSYRYGAVPYDYYYDDSYGYGDGYGYGYGYYPPPPPPRYYRPRPRVQFWFGF
jgi:hypothetical protein